MRRVAAILLFLVAPAVAAQETKQVDVFSYKISYIEAGSGPPVILLHGLGANKNAWALAIPGLSSKFHLYVPDQIGFGASDKPLLKYRVATYGDFLNEFMRKLGIAKASIIGNSMGGWVAADFAIRYPERVDRVVLTGTGGYFTRPFTKNDIAFLNPGSLEETRQLVKKVFFREQMHNDAFVAFVFAERMRAGDAYTIDRLLDSAVRREDALNDRLGSLRAPALLLNGREDPIVSVADVETIARQIPGAKELILEDCGHVPQFECTEAFVKAASGFLSLEIK